MTKGPRLRVIQIGDVHFPDAVKERPEADIKRDPFDTSQVIAPSGLRLQKITQSLSTLGEEKIDAILFMGDLTTGNPDVAVQEEGLERCIEYLTENITEPLLGSDRNAKTMFVPGNHDVNRTKCPSHGVYDPKFDLYINHLHAFGYSNISIPFISRMDIANPDAAGTIFGINTSLGCGEFMVFPDQMKDDLAGKLAATLDPAKRTQIKDLLNQFMDLTERLDAPLIDGALLSQLDLHITTLLTASPHAIPIVVGHHNLLPQLIPRVAPFSELMNSGILRAFLSEKLRPVCYLHGHIHDDPIEIILNQREPDGGVIAISAPQFIDGYNLLEFHFNDNSIPQGVAVTPFRQEKTGKLKRHTRRLIPFLQGPHKLSSISGIAREIFSTVFASGKTHYFTDLTNSYPNQSTETIAQAIVELEWIGVVEIVNRSRTPGQWNIRAAI